MADSTFNGRTASLMATAMVLACISPVISLNAQADDDTDPALATLENGKLEAALYSIRSAKRDQKPIKLHVESLLKWQNTVNQSVHGNIFVWTKEGRPELVVSIYQFFSPKKEFAAEFHSLSLDPLVIEKNGKEVWTPKEPGITFKAFDAAAEPSASAAQRLIQMKTMADQFTVQLTDWSGETYRLRLMPRPLFRYGAPDSEVLDGALFAFTYTTDPELLVMVEARKSDKGFRWMYGHARMNIGELKVSFRDREVWTAPRLEHPYFYKEGVYTLFKDRPLPTTRNTGN